MNLSPPAGGFFEQKKFNIKVKKSPCSKYHMRLLPFTNVGSHQSAVLITLLKTCQKNKVLNYNTLLKHFKKHKYTYCGNTLQHGEILYKYKALYIIYKCRHLGYNSIIGQTAYISRVAPTTARWNIRYCNRSTRII